MADGTNRAGSMGRRRPTGPPRPEGYERLLARHRWDSPSKVRTLYERVFGRGCAPLAFETLNIAAAEGLIGNGSGELGTWACSLTSLAPSTHEPGPGVSARADSHRCAVLLGLLLEYPYMCTDGELTGGDANIRAVIDCGFDRLVAAFRSFIVGAHGLGLAKYVRRLDDFSLIMPTTMAMLSLAMNHMADMGFGDVDMRGDPTGYGSALATSWYDIRERGITPDEAYVLPTVDLIERWRRALHTARRAPLCVSSTHALAWLEGLAVDPVDLALSWRATTDKRNAASIVAALESDGARDYSAARAWAHGHGAIDAAANYGTDVIMDALSMCDTPARTLAVLELCDALTLAAGGDPSCPDAGYPGYFEYDDSGDIYGSVGWGMALDDDYVPSALTEDAIDRAIGLLEDGCPIDMVAEDPLVHVPDDEGDDNERSMGE